MSSLIFILKQVLTEQLMSLQVTLKPFVIEVLDLDGGNDIVIPPGATSTLKLFITTRLLLIYKISGPNNSVDPISITTRYIASVNFGSILYLLDLEAMIL
jgi:hypothetical protein